MQSTVSQRRTAVAAVQLAASVALGAAVLLSPAPASSAPPPWQRTETRADCSSFDVLRQPYFGDTHVHTSYSSDAVFTQVVGGPREAYDFALGQPLGLPPLDAMGNPTRSAQLRRALDWTVVTDHSEQFGEMQICLVPGLDDGYDDSVCVGVRDQLATPIDPLPPPLPPASFIAMLLPYTNLLSPTRFSWCGAGGADCLAQASVVWQDIQDAADEYYDRSSACTFTTFIGYEWTATPSGDNLHRNVIFRNDVVQALPTSYLEQQTAEGFLSEIKSECIDAGNGCDLLAIPHNSALSRGRMFQPALTDGTPFNAADATLRRDMEPVVEITQHKGDSECRPGVGTTTDELCGYEKSNKLQLFGTSDPANVFAPLSFTRNALLEGLSQEESLGVNPFMFGVVGSTDTHNATPGFVNEEDFAAAGHLGLRDSDPIRMLTIYPPGGVEANPGGLAVVWAEENSRDAIFSAMRRREVYATSGNRPIVRMFAGKYSKHLCDDPDFVEKGYAGGVPMGGELGPVRKTKSPTFAVMATRDPAAWAAPLERIQIIKGWLDGGGAQHEQVFDVAGTPGTGSVDLDTCETSGTGSDTLCTVWEDPNFDPSERAFYYARVLETPVCRWSTRLCNQLGVDCSDLPSVPAEYIECCNADRPRSIQERAWTSANFYRPDGIAAYKAVLKDGKSAGEDRLKLKITLGEVPAAFDLTSGDLSITIHDDDAILDVTFPAGSFEEKKAGVKYKLSTPVGPVAKASFKVTGKGQGKLAIKTGKTDLSAADRSDHMIESHIAIGTYDADHARLWRYDGKKLKVK
jgi:hypothetical protein